ncbi:MAG: hypothetical protein ACPLUL_14030 [Thermanaerothrix sp.]|uniref:hypothetical protein n=1 Tax=Thermanaerothrix sp. TaxID=2972675 RepID=UPI003C7C7331
MIDERVTLLGPAIFVTIVGVQVIARDLQIQAVQYAWYGIIGVAVFAGLYFGIRRALGSWTRRKWLSAAGWIAGFGLFFLGLSGVGNISLLVGAIVCVWVGVIAAVLNEEV